MDTETTIPQSHDGINDYASLGNKQKILAHFYNASIGEKCTAETLSQQTSIQLKIVWNETAELVKANLLEDAGKTGRLKLYRLSGTGRRLIDSWLESWNARQHEVVSQLVDPSEKVAVAKQLLMHPGVERCLTAIPKFVRVPWSVIVEFPDFADLLLDNPDEGLSWLRVGLEKLDLPSFNDTEFRRVDFLILDVPNSSNISLSELSSQHLNKLVSCEAILSRMSEMHPRTISARFECPGCGVITPVLMPSIGKRRDLNRCVCGRKGKFNLLSEEKVDTRFLSLEEPTEFVSEQMSPDKKKATLSNSLAQPTTVRFFPPGSRVRVVAIPREIPRLRKEGGEDVCGDIYLEVISVTSLQDESFDLTLQKDDVLRCQEMSQRFHNEGLRSMVDSFSPYVYGQEDVKEILLLMALSGKNTLRPGESKISRKNIHVLIVGDTGTAKTTLAKSLLQLIPRSRYAFGNQSSGAGLIGAVEKDTVFNMGWSLEAGQLVLAHNSVCVIDELDKMQEEDHNYFLEVMEEQQATINKATIKQTLIAWTGILGLANPKSGRFNTDQNLAEQIELQSYILNRFDIIVTILDVPNVSRDESTVKTMLQMQLDISHGTTIETPYTVDDLRKFVLYVRQQQNPEFTEEASKNLQEFYLNIRRQYNKTHQVPINARTMESILRLSIAYARARLSKTVDKLDTDRATRLYTALMQRVLTDIYTGSVSVDTVDHPYNINDKICTMVKLADEITTDDLIDKSIKEGFKKKTIENVIQTLLSEGRLFSPRPGVLRCLE